jgi:RimJ/RimL family protein N-acetyltransferase
MSDFPIDRTHPPRRISYRAGGQDLEIRPWSLDDVDALLAAVEASRPALRAFMTWSHTPQTREGEFDVVRRFSTDYWAGREYIMGVFSPAAGIVGGVGLHPRTPLNPKALEVGYWCHSAHAGQGIATLATKMLSVLVFDYFACNRFQVQHDQANPASGRVVEKCGFAFEGKIRNGAAVATPELIENGYAGTGHMRMYGMLPSDFSTLPWVDDIRGGLRVYNALGDLRTAT